MNRIIIRRLTMRCSERAAGRRGCNRCASWPPSLRVVRPLRTMSENAPGWYEPKDKTPRHQCPCCDYVSLPERGQYLICHVCFWEDDGLDVDQLDTHWSEPHHFARGTHELR